jgi:hypothetical protein
MQVIYNALLSKNNRKMSVRPFVVTFQKYLGLPQLQKTALLSHDHVSKVKCTTLQKQFLSSKAWNAFATKS